MIPVLGELASWLDGPHHSDLRRAFQAFVGRVIVGLGVEEELPDNFMEARTMIEERVLRWEKRLRREGKAEGKAEGLAEGEAKGKAEFLLRLLRKKFSALDPTWIQRVQQAPEAQLDAWTDRLLEATTVDEVFDAPPDPH